MTDTNPNNNSGESPFYANVHIPSFLELALMDLDDTSNMIQVIRDGVDLTAERIRRGHLSIDRPVVVTDTPESIGMTVPPRDNFGIQDVADMVGGAYPVHVLDVQLQTELEGWTIGDLVEYFQDSHRQAWNQQHQTTSYGEQQEDRETFEESSSPSQLRPRRAAALQSEAATSRPPVLNQLSLEFSRTSMGPPFVQSPQFVRDMDWIDLCWPITWRNKQKYPIVQYYCLTSAQGAWTDFHVDFGGTSVWYHILSGCKEFCLVPPTEANLQAYQTWLCSKHQEAEFFPDNLAQQQNNVYRIRLQAHQTLVIPSGWIHAVYTPTDSLVLGGNFLHGLAINNQLRVWTIEEASHVPNEMLFPYYRQIHVCAAGYYYAQLLLDPGQLVKQEKENLPRLIQQVETWVYQDDGKSFKEDEQPTVQQLAQSIAQKHSVSSFGALLDDFRRLLQKTESVGSNAPLSSSATTPRPRIRLRTKAIATPSTPKDDSSDNETEPLIQLSSPQRALPIPANLVTSRKREDAASFVDQDDEWTPQDDEWTPTSDTIATSKRSNRGGAKRPKLGSKSSGGNQKRGNSVRNRLMKKLK